MLSENPRLREKLLSWATSHFKTWPFSIILSCLINFSTSLLIEAFYIILDSYWTCLQNGSLKAGLWSWRGLCSNPDPTTQSSWVVLDKLLNSMKVSQVVIRITLDNVWEALGTLCAVWLLISHDYDFYYKYDLSLRAS